MAVQYVIELEGDPKDLLARYDRAKGAFEEKGARLRADSALTAAIHTCTVTPKGIRISEIIDGSALRADSGASLASLSGDQILEWLQKNGLVDESQRQAVKRAGLTDVPYKQSLSELHNLSIVKS